MDRGRLLERVRRQRRIAWVVVCSSVQAQARFELQRSSGWVAKVRGAGLRQRAELVRGQSIAVRLGLDGDAPWGSGGAVSGGVHGGGGGG